MIRIPQFRGDEQVFPLKHPGLERFAYRIAHRFLIAVAFGAIEMAKTHLQCGLGGLLGRDMIRNQRAESDCGDRTGSVAELNPGIAQRIRCRHAHIPSLGDWSTKRYAATVSTATDSRDIAAFSS
jgi:hypothetical protein